MLGSLCSCSGSVVGRSPRRRRRGFPRNSSDSLRSAYSARRLPVAATRKRFGCCWWWTTRRPVTEDWVGVCRRRATRTTSALHCVLTCGLDHVAHLLRVRLVRSLQQQPKAQGCQPPLLRLQQRRRLRQLRSVPHRLEPQTSKPQADLLLMRMSLACTVRRVWQALQRPECSRAARAHTPPTQLSVSRLRQHVPWHDGHDGPL